MGSSSGPHLETDPGLWARIPTPSPLQPAPHPGRCEGLLTRHSENEKIISVIDYLLIPWLMCIEMQFGGK